MRRTLSRTCRGALRRNSRSRPLRRRWRCSGRSRSRRARSRYRWTNWSGCARRRRTRHSFRCCGSRGPSRCRRCCSRRLRSCGRTWRRSGDRLRRFRSFGHGWRRWRDHCRFGRRNRRDSGDGRCRGRCRTRARCLRGRILSFFFRLGLGFFRRFRVGYPLNVSAHLLRNVGGNGAGVCLFFCDAVPGQQVNNGLGLDLQLAREFVNSYLSYV